METINEQVDVGAVFGAGSIKPKWFMWKGRKHDIKETTYIWHEREGIAEITHFTVTDGATLFELSLNNKTMSWTLEAADAGN